MRRNPLPIPHPMPATTHTKPGRGRPKSENPRNIIWPIRLSEEEVAALDKKAKKTGKQRGTWIRETLLSATA